MKIVPEKELRPARFLDSAPFFHSRKFAREYDVDLCVPNGIGVGNIVCFSRLVEDYARSLGRPISLLTAPFCPAVGTVPEECDYPFWEYNPFISKIINADLIDSEIMRSVVMEQDNYCQFGHVIENLCFQYEIQPRALRGSLFLSASEITAALQRLSKLKRPIICLHISGTSSSAPNSPWHKDRWNQLIDHFGDRVTWVQIGLSNWDGVPLPKTVRFETTLREAMGVIAVSDLFVGFDSGPAHIATALQRPCLVLWDAQRKEELEKIKHPGFASAMLLRWSYPQNKNIVILEERFAECFQQGVRWIEENLASLKS